ncbi:ATP-binding protein [Acinetobacter chinensis]|uniref:ATP-binding protein n=1 Tax=Acinetobacter chinensis TaxID=2004650 RepID=A0ABU3WEM8_9GAMM|nr:ATP-binding protein [Acinetobacter chinensis]MDV2468876.1 ATP-binding protein [Acinetobacter chinensis]
MNAMISMNFPQVQAFCAEHCVQMVQAGPDQICPECAKNAVNKNNREHQKHVDQMVRELHFGGAMIPARHKDSGFRNYKTVHDGQSNALSSCVDFAKTIIARQKRNLIMTGKTGTGKTHLSCATARTLLSKGIYVRYITSEDMANEIANAWKKPDDSESSAVYRFSEYDLLIVDEYGLHDRHENRLQLVHKVLYSRYDAGKATMIVSNMTAHELQKDLGDRLWSRFQHDGLVMVECNWADQRVGGGV